MHFSSYLVVHSRNLNPITEKGLFTFPKIIWNATISSFRPSFHTFWNWDIYYSKLKSRGAYASLKLKQKLRPKSKNRSLTTKHIKIIIFLKNQIKIELKQFKDLLIFLILYPELILNCRRRTSTSSADSRKINRELTEMRTLYLMRISTRYSRYSIYQL